MEIVQQRDPQIPLRTACAAVGLPRATVYRRLRPRPSSASRARPRSPRRLSDDERARVLEVLHSERFADQPPAEVYATLLEEGHYLASPRTMYRILAEAKESRERRPQRAPRSFPKPSLQATAPNQVWTWDITKLPTFTAGVFLSLYVILDLWSRYAVAWMIAQRENSALAKQLFAEALTRYAIEPGSLIVHMDRGAPMTSLGFADLLSVLGADQSFSRPRISNDNPFSEANFRTIKYQPDYPGLFHETRDACFWAADFFTWYNRDHHHHGIALFTPETLFFGRLESAAAKRQTVLDAAYAAHPERFLRGRPVVKLPPRTVAINPVAPELEPVNAGQILAADDPYSLFPTPQAEAPSPTVVETPGAQNPAPIQ